MSTSLFTEECTSCQKVRHTWKIPCSRAKEPSQRLTTVSWQCNTKGKRMTILLQCKTGPWIPPSLLGISIKSWGGSPRKCLKWLESFLMIWKWKSAVTNSSPATKPLPPRLCIAPFVPSSSPAFANSRQWKQWSSLASNAGNARAVCDCSSGRHPPIPVSNWGRSD